MENLTIYLLRHLNRHFKINIGSCLWPYTKRISMYMEDFDVKNKSKINKSLEHVFWLWSREHLSNNDLQVRNHHITNIKVLTRAKKMPFVRWKEKWLNLNKYNYLYNNRLYADYEKLKTLKKIKLCSMYALTLFTKYLSLSCIRLGAHFFAHLN